MSELPREALKRVLAGVGELLAADGEHHAIVVAGGASLNLLGLVDRTTQDVDVIARAERDEQSDALRLVHPDPIPPSLERAIVSVARDFGLNPNSMNTEVAAQWKQELPPWIADDISWTTLGGGLDVGLLGRTLIALKLYAAADHAPGSVHFQDLIALGPTDSELDEARSWVVSQDELTEWPRIVDEVVEHAKRRR